MGVRKFRSVEEMERPASYAPDDPRIWQDAVRRWEIHRFLTTGARPTARPGVFKFRSIEEKQVGRTR